MKFKKKKRRNTFHPLVTSAQVIRPRVLFVCVCVCYRVFFTEFFFYICPRGLCSSGVPHRPMMKWFVFWNFFFMEGVGWAPLSQFLIKKKPKKKNKLTLFLTGVRWKCFFLIFYYNFFEISFFLTSQEKSCVLFFGCRFFFSENRLGTATMIHRKKSTFFYRVLPVKTKEFESKVLFLFSPSEHQFDLPSFHGSYRFFYFIFFVTFRFDFSRAIAKLFDCLGKKK